MTDKVRPFRVSDEHQDDNASEIRKIIHGTVTLDLPSLTTLQVATATAAVAGARPGMRYFGCFPTSAVSACYALLSVLSRSADTIEFGFMNPHSATVDPTATDINYFGIR